MIHDVMTCTCYSCELAYLRVEAARQAETEPSDPLESAIERYITSLHEDGIALHERISVAAVLDDLCRLGEIPTPLAVSTALRHI